MVRYELRTVDSAVTYGHQRPRSRLVTHDGAHMVMGYSDCQLA